MVGGDNAVQRVGGLAALGGTAQKIDQLLARHPRFGRIIPKGQRVPAGVKNVVNVRKLGSDQFQIAIDQGAWIKKLE